MNYIQSAVKPVGLDVVQLHDDAPDTTISLIPAPVIRVIHVRSGENVSNIDAGVVSAVHHGAAPVLLDAAAAVTSTVNTGTLSCSVPNGGTGQVFYWSVASQLASTIYIKLAGGLTNESVGQVGVLGSCVWGALIRHRVWNPR